MEGLVVYTVAFLIYGVLEVLGLMPQEITSSGLTLSGIFGKYYGDPNVNFIMYQVRRSTITTLVHTSLPLIYCLGLSMIDSSFFLMNVAQWTLWTVLVWIISLVISLLGIAVGIYWFYNNWMNHPLVVQLGKMERPWRNVAASINLEFRDINKFLSELGGSTLVVTDSWILQCNVHTIYILHQRDAVLNVASSDEYLLSMNSNSKQFITVNVNSTNSKFKSFDIRLNSQQYSILCDRLLSPIRIARNVVIYQSLNDRFASAFAEQVERNGVYTLSEGLDELQPCVGCLQTLPEVKLRKLCSDVEIGSCRQCFCKPMWCLLCMSKWFAARQNQHKPEEWMASCAPCPMCRATFCMLDIQKIRKT